LYPVATIHWWQQMLFLPQMQVGWGPWYLLFCANLLWKVFSIEKRIIRIMAGTKRRACCRQLFNMFNILPLASEFLLSLLSLSLNFLTNLDLCNISTRDRYSLLIPNTNPSKYQKRVYCTGIKLFSNVIVLELSYSVIKSLNHGIKMF
jgi:hypothetical protein